MIKRGRGDVFNMGSIAGLGVNYPLSKHLVFGAHQSPAAP